MLSDLQIGYFLKFEVCYGKEISTDFEYWEEALGWMEEEWLRKQPQEEGVGGGCAPSAYFGLP